MSTKSVPKNTNSSNAVNALVATAVAEAITLPICTLKTNYQNAVLPTSMTALAKQMYTVGGVKAFYRAGVPAIGGQILSTTIKWTLYKHLQNNVTLFGNGYKNANTVANGVMSGVVATLVTHPVDVIKIHWQMGQKFPGVTSMYRGYSKSFTKVAIGSSLFFPLNDICKDYFRKFQSLSSMQQAVCASFSSAVISTTIMHPVDYMKTRHIYNQPVFAGWNPLHYYRGYTLNLLRVVPHFTITMSVIAYLEKYLWN